MEKPSLDTAKAGAMRFNTDSSQMEIYDGNQWTGILSTSPELQTGGTRAVFWHGSPNTDVIQFFNVDSTGNATDMGDLTVARMYISSSSNSTRGLFGGGYTGSNSDVIDYITIASTGNPQ